MKTLLAKCIFVSLALAALAGCDPIQDDQLAALGNDPSGERNGPLHRAGQPCLVCHGEGGLGNGPQPFSVAGTVYLKASDLEGLSGASVKLTSTGGSSITLTTNQVGNFYVPASRWTPVYPMDVTVTYQGTTAVMQTHVGRDGSCASCHKDPRGPGSPGHVYFIDDADAGPAPPPVLDAGADAAEGG